MLSIVVISYRRGDLFHLPQALPIRIGRRIFNRQPLEIAFVGRPAPADAGNRNAGVGQRQQLAAPLRIAAFLRQEEDPRHDRRSALVAPDPHRRIGRDAAGIAVAQHRRGHQRQRRLFTLSGTAHGAQATLHDAASSPASRATGPSLVLPQSQANSTPKATDKIAACAGRMLNSLEECPHCRPANSKASSFIRMPVTTPAIDGVRPNDLDAGSFHATGACESASDSPC